MTSSMPLSPAQRDFLRRRVESARSTPAETIAQYGESTAPLSFAQERLWVMDQITGNNHNYNVYHAMRLIGALDAAALRRALDRLVAQHESLRTTFVTDDAGPRQDVAPPAPVQFEEQDLEGLPAGRRDAAAQEHILTACRQPFDLARGPLFRAVLLRCSGREHLLVLVLHHIITDGWSTQILARDLAAFYGGESSIGSPVRYVDYAAWQREQLVGDTRAKLIRYWRAALADQPQVLQLPTDHAGAPGGMNVGAEHRVLISAELLRRLREVAKAQETSLFVVLLTAVRILLRAHTGQDRFILASSIAGRIRPELEEVVGNFVNTLALGGELRGDLTFREAVSQEHSTMMGAVAHQELPFDIVVRELSLERDLGRNPLAQVFVQFDEGGAEGWRLPGLTVEELRVSNDVAKFDLSFFFRDLGDVAVLTIEYAVALFDAATIQRLGDRLVQLLRSATGNPECSLARTIILPESEQRTLRDAWNDTVVDISLATLPDLLADRAKRSGDAVAIRFGNHSLTYRDWECQANRLAGFIRSRGVKSGDLVAVFLERDLYLPVAMIAIQKAGAAYVPLNPGEPAGRIKLILEDARPAMVLTQQKLRTELPADCANVLLLENCSDEIDAMSDGAVVGDWRPDDLAYVIFTSGSTGRPKGVAVPHRGIINFLLTMAQRPGITDKDVLLAVTTPSFDIAALELFLPLMVGAQTVIADQASLLDGRRLRQLIADTGTTILQATPATWRLLAGAPELANVTALVGGEALTLDVAVPLVEAASAVWNMYGPTETTVWSTIRRLEERDLRDGAGAMPIGRPIGNTTCFVLNSELQMVPAGVAGELHIGGDGVARGYYGRPGLTAERFVPNPYGHPGSRIYRTGDLVRYRSNGDLEFLGRNDHQVKIRGYRIETSEIAAHLVAHEKIDQAVVTAHEYGPGDTRLVAYIKTSGADNTELRRYLAVRLPSYMIPSTFVTLHDFPLTPNGKVDRKALPAPNRAPAAGAAQPPRTHYERVVGVIWAEILDAAVPSVHENFFAIGGHSLLAIQAVNRINETFDIDLEVRALLDTPTIEGLAAEVDTASRRPRNIAGRRDPVPGGLPVRASLGQERMWLLQQMSPNRPGYHLSVELRIKGRLDVDALQSALDLVTRRHQSLRTRLRWSGDKLWQVLEPAEGLHLVLDDLRGLSGAQETAEKLLNSAAGTLFDLADEPPMRARLVRLADEEHILSLVVHHAAADGWSLDLLRNDLSIAYRTAITREDGVLPEPPLQSAEYAEIQRSQIHDEDVRYWHEELEGLRPLTLMSVGSSASMTCDHCATVHFELTAELTGEVIAFAKARSTTPFVVLLAAYQGTIAKVAGRTDIGISTPVSVRTGTAAAELFGMFINTLVIRADLSNAPSFGELADRTRDRVARGLVHRHVPFESMVEKLTAPRDGIGRTVALPHFTCDAEEPARWSFQGLEVERLGDRTLSATHELALSITRSDNRFLGTLEFLSDHHEPAVMEAFVGEYVELLRDGVRAPESHISVVGRAADPPDLNEPAAGSSPSRPPAEPAECTIAEIWEELLGVPVEDVYQDFFSLGGNSLLVARLRTRLAEAFGVDLDMPVLFEKITVAAQADDIRQRIEDELAAITDYADLTSFIQQDEA